MPSCMCEFFGERLRRPLHVLHKGIAQQIQQQARQVAALAPRYLAALRRRLPADPERDRLLEQLRCRLRRIHDVGQRYLPAEDRYVVRRGGFPAISGQAPASRYETSPFTGFDHHSEETR